MKKKDKDYLISAGILLVIGWFVAGIICWGTAWYLCNKVEEKSTVRAILKTTSMIGTLYLLFYHFTK